MFVRHVALKGFRQPGIDRSGVQGHRNKVLIAAGDTFQIWKPETYEAEEAARTEEWLDDLPDDFDPLIFLDNAKGE